MVARYYSSSLARFMAVDPGDDTDLEDPQSWNKYAYTRNNPLKWVDETGRDIKSPFVYDTIRNAGQPRPSSPPGPVARTVEAVAQGTSSTSSTLGTAAALTALVATAMGFPEVGAPLMMVAGTAGITTVAADTTAALANPSPENQGAVAGDIAAYAAGAGVNALVTKAAGGTTPMVEAASGVLQEAAAIPVVAVAAGVTEAMLEPSTPAASESKPKETPKPVTKPKAMDNP